MNALHDLVRELSGIRDHHDAFYAYFSEIQGFAFEGLVSVRGRPSSRSDNLMAWSPHNL